MMRVRTSRTSRVLESAVGSVRVDSLERRLLLSAQTANIWRVLGSAEAETIAIAVSPTDATQLQATINGRVVSTRPLAKVRGILVRAGAGNDRVTVSLGAGFESIRTTLRGGSGDDVLEGGNGKDVIWGGSGSDTVEGGMGNDVLVGENGTDLVSGEEGNDLVYGGRDNDLLTGGQGKDSLDGDLGNDQLSGGFGDDLVLGDDGVDTLRGGEGRDTLNGGRGNDVVFREKSDYWRYNRYDVTKADRLSNPLQKASDLADLRKWLIESAVKQWKWAFGQPAWWMRYPMNGEWLDGAVVASPTGGAVKVESPDHSNTNTQVLGVDEADIVKTDGNYIYLVHDRELVVMDAYPAEETSILTKTAVEGYPTGIYVEGDRLTVIASEWGGWPVWGGDVAVMAPMGGGRFMPWRSDPKTIVTVYDVSDREVAPAVVSKIEIDGSVSSSRSIDGSMYLVMNSDLSLPAPQTVEGPEKGQVLWESEESYRTRLEGLSLEELAPGYTTTAGGVEENGSLLDGELYVPESGRTMGNLFSVMRIDMLAETPEPSSPVSVMGFSGTVYVSKQNLYVTSQAWDSPMGDWRGEYRTDIHKFALGEKIAYEGTGSVAGWAVNQFAMDESAAGDLRIATTTEEGGRSNNLFVLRDVGETLKVVGGLTQLALTERIYSARFVGDRAYLVTFRQTDPLFAIDVSDATKPELKGVLEMPGYSSYLHPIGEDYLIGFGRDADATGRVNGLKLSLFDVRDMANPKEVDAYKFEMDPGPGGWWSWNSSAAEWDHHAFSYFAEQGVLAVPVLDYGWWNGQAKLAVLKVDTTSGFSELGEVRQSGQVLRSLRIEDYLYSIGSDAVKVVPLDDVSNTVAEVVLVEPPVVIEPIQDPVIMG